MKRSLILAGILVWSWSCSRDRNPISTTTDSDFAVYFLKDSSLSTSQVINLGLSKLELEAAPWFDAGDVEFYDFSTRCIYLKSNKRTLFANFGLGHFEPRLTDKPFVVAAGGNRCYLGCLHSGALSTTPAGPYMDELDVWHFPDDVLHVSRHRASTEDARSDPRVREALIRRGLFHAGLRVELNSVSVVRNADTTTVQYRFTLTNEDRDPPYVIDPDRTGTELLHYYTNGVVLSNESQPQIWSEYKSVTSPVPHDSWAPCWFTRMKGSQSIQRTVTLRGYPRIPRGRYVCRLEYSGPKTIVRTERNMLDGRYWLGEIASKTMEVVLD